ncbi:hypothetical protein BaRGS_00032188, partial [Batillaria attramentaria]
FASRTCQPDGTWVKHPTQENSNKTWTNFTACVVPTPELPDISHHAVGTGRLQSKSNTLHINLFLAFILRAVLASLKDHLFVGGLGLPKDVTFKNVDGRIIMDFIQEGEHWECRLITVLFFFTISATQTWILMEGLYLFMLIHQTMITERLGVTPYILLGWGEYIPNYIDPHMCCCGAEPSPVLLAIGLFVSSPLLQRTYPIRQVPLCTIAEWHPQETSALWGLASITIEITTSYKPT